MAKMNVTTSNRSIPGIPVYPRNIPAPMGASIPDAASASEIMPLALEYCSLSSITDIAAEYAGNWND